jgi:hypothetical protein
LRELGGFLWIQITAAIVFVRLVFWLMRPLGGEAGAELMQAGLKGGPNFQ